jgi:hypothetical protein
LKQLVCAKKWAVAFLLVLSPAAWSAQELIVRKAIDVYAKPNSSSEVLTTLDEGERVPIAAKEEGRFRKVLIQSGGKKRVGYVLKSRLEGSRIRERNGKSAGKAKKADSYHRRFAIVLPVTLSYTKQNYTGNDNIVTADGSKYTLSSLSGTSVYFGVGLDIPLQEKLALRAELLFRSIDGTGSLKASGGAGNPQEVQRSMTALSGGVLGKYYFDAGDDFWVGGGLEVAKVNNVAIVFANRDNLRVNESDYPTFIILKAAAGYDTALTDDISLIPDVRFLYFVNASPVIYGAELTLALAYAF